MIIPVLNGIPFLGEQLEALAQQASPPPFEVILSDNGSTDGSQDVAERFRDRLCIRSIDASAQRGQTHARNMGVAASRGRLLLFLDQDDRVGSTYVAAMARALLDHDVVAARMETTLLNPGWVSQAREIAQTSGLGREPAPWAYACSLGLARAVFDEVGGFDTALDLAGEDVDLCLRLAEAGRTLTYVPEAVLHYRFPTTKRQLFLQGRRYGRGQELVHSRHGVASGSWGGWARSLLGPLCLVAMGRGTGARAQGWFLLGRRVGSAEGRLRSARSPG